MRDTFQESDVVALAVMIYASRLTRQASLGWKSNRENSWERLQMDKMDKAAFYFGYTFGGWPADMCEYRRSMSVSSLKLLGDRQTACDTLELSGRSTFSPPSASRAGKFQLSSSASWLEN
jgi:hypothetical protein